MNEQFWKTKSLEQMSDKEWESLCDGCGKCCLLKLEDIDTGEIGITNIHCTLFENETCKCTDYFNRFKRVETCLKMDREGVEKAWWLPDSCAYKLVGKGYDLPVWHHLVTGSLNDIHEAGASVQHQTLSEDHIKEEDLENFIIALLKPEQNDINY